MTIEQESKSEEFPKEYAKYCGTNFLYTVEARSTGLEPIEFEGFFFYKEWKKIPSRLISFIPPMPSLYKACPSLIKDDLLSYEEAEVVRWGLLCYFTQQNNKNIFEIETRIVTHRIDYDVKVTSIDSHSVQKYKA